MLIIKVITPIIPLIIAGLSFVLYMLKIDIGKSINQRKPPKYENVFKIIYLPQNTIVPGGYPMLDLYEKRGKRQVNRRRQ